MIVTVAPSAGATVATDREAGTLRNVIFESSPSGSAKPADRPSRRAPPAIGATRPKAAEMSGGWLTGRPGDLEDLLRRRAALIGRRHRLGARADRAPTDIVSVRPAAGSAVAMDGDADTLPNVILGSSLSGPCTRPAG